MYPKIFAISGKIGCGKDFIALNYIIPFFKNIAIMTFGDHLKLICITKYGSTFDEMYTNKNSISRMLLQNVGKVEKEVNPNIFIDVMDVKLRLAFERKVDIVIITDLRFKKEFDYLKKIKATMIRLISPQRTIDKTNEELKNMDQKDFNIIKNDISEIDLDDYKDFDYYFNNDYDNNKNIEGQIKNMLTQILV